MVGNNAQLDHRSALVDPDEASVAFDGNEEEAEDHGSDPDDRHHNSAVEEVETVPMTEVVLLVQAQDRRAYHADHHMGLVPEGADGMEGTPRLEMDAGEEKGGATDVEKCEKLPMNSCFSSKAKVWFEIVWKTSVPLDHYYSTIPVRLVPLF